ncbi:MAG: MBL fold metallo-hydrolase [Syntrophomonadaceae bacterium]|nr:MBL fold metallo-hydrolase [Syntrophomonadaceae bacterium]
MILKGLELGGIGANCYIIGCEETKEGAVIDPGGGAASILKVVKEEGLVIKYIINTHGHIDHIGANTEIKEATGADILIHEKDAKMLTSSAANFSMFMGRKVTSPAASWLLKDGDTIKIGKTIQLEVIHTPGHTQGGICLKTGNVLFSGDTLFASSIGRTDFPGGSYKTLISSIKERLMSLDDDVVVYPGHMQPTTIGYERRNNPFLD